MRPVQFTRYTALPGRLQRAVNDRPYKPTYYTVAGHTLPPPYHTVFKRYPTRNTVWMSCSSPSLRRRRLICTSIVRLTPI